MLTIITLLLLPLTLFAGHTGEFDGLTYYNDGDLNVYWSAVAKATYYEVRATYVNPSNAALNQNYSYGPYTDLSVNLQQKRAGFFRLAVRACSATQCSVWGEGINSATAANGKPWQVFWNLPRPVVVIN